MGKDDLDPRQRLLEAGLKHFANRGYAGTSILDITREAKVTKPTLYYYFQSKEGLFRALVDQAMDERLQLMQQAAPAGKKTVDQLTDIIVALTGFARRQPDLLRICFSIAFAAPEEIPVGFKKNEKMKESYLFAREIIQQGRENGILNKTFNIDELTQAYFHLIQHSVVLALFEAKGRHHMQMPPRTEPRRMVELFLVGAAAEPSPPLRSGTSRLARIAVYYVATCLAISSLSAQTTSAPPPTNAASYPAVPISTASTTNAPPAIATPDITSTARSMTASAPTSTTDSTNMPTVADIRPVPIAVSASHPELATVSPIAANSHNPRALDLQTCFQLTALRDDSLKISTHDIEIARAQLSQSIAALWPTFTATNQQQFIHYGNTTGGTSFADLGGTGVGGTGTGFTTTTTGDRNYTSQSHITMNYTVFNGAQNYNAVGASAAVVASRKETLARDYQTIYQSVAQAFYNVLQYEGDLVIQHDLIEALSARVDDLKDRVKLGRSRPSELLQAQTDMANAKVTEESEKGSVNAARETVAFYTGVPSAELALKDTQKFPTAGQLATYLQRSGSRPDVLAQVENLRQAERNLDVATGQVFPTVTASGDYLASQDPVSNSVDATMTLQISMPIFDGGLILAQIHQNHEMVRESVLNIQQVQRTADQDTRTAYVNFTASVAQVVVLREAATLAAKNLEAQVDDYRRGVVSNLDVLTALQDYQTARTQLHNANMQTRYNLINLHVAAGMAATGPNANNVALPSHTGTAP